ncbi:hypothetical protein [Persicitalea sp.]|uniref:hypothetical protein n=1 Tax=Persicitalea sp. TaxID=3100273 RepID=UPI00359310B4
MQLTYKITADTLDDVFLEAIKSQFAGKEVNITIEEAESAVVDPIDQFHKMEKLRKKLKRIKVDSSINLSALANELNL